MCSACPAHLRRRLDRADDRDKQVPTCCKIFAGLTALGVDARLCIVGDGPTRAEAETLANELGIMRKCLFLGYHRDVASFYHLFDAFLRPSANEGTPVSVIEALAAQRPVVATAVGGVPDVVENGVHGYLVAPRRRRRCGSRARRARATRSCEPRMGTAGRAWVLPRYAVERLVDDVDTLYRSLLAAKGLPSPTRRFTTSR